MVYDISIIIERVPEMIPMDITVNNVKRNPHREFTIEREERKKAKRGPAAAAAMDSDSEIEESKLPDDKHMLVQESEITTILKKKRVHDDVIKSIQYIHCTDRPLILTGSTDRLVKLIDLATSEEAGVLKQGYKAMPNYKWDFPITRLLRDKPERMTRMQ